MPVIPVSVILPVFNAEAYVGEALASIVAQTYRNFEAIVIDDGSHDHSLRIIRQHVGNDPRFVIVSRPNRGLVETCNEGMELAKGEIIFRMDADDAAHPDRFARQLSFLEAHPDCVAVGTRVMLADDSMMPILEAHKHLTHAVIDAENMEGRSAICHPSVAIRRDALLAIGGYRKEFEWAEDLDLFLRLAEVGQLANLPDVLLTYRQHLSSVGYSKRALQRTRATLAVRAAARRRGLSSAAVPTEGAAQSEASASEGDAVLESDYRCAGDVYRKWAWLALIGGHPKTARKHALLALRTDPWCRENPRLIACALRGR